MLPKFLNYVKTNEFKGIIWYTNRLNFRLYSYYFID